MISYRNQKSTGFFDNYNVRLVPFAIQDAEGNYKFKNSAVIVKYIFAAEKYRAGYGIKLLDHIFTNKNEDGISYQNLFNEDYDNDKAVAQLDKWLHDDGLHTAEIKELKKQIDSEVIQDKMSTNKNIVENELRVKGIPTMLYDGGRHTGLYKTE